VDGDRPHLAPKRAFKNWHALAVTCQQQRLHEMIQHTSYSLLRCFLTPNHTLVLLISVDLKNVFCLRRAPRLLSHHTHYQWELPWEVDQEAACSDLTVTCDYTIIHTNQINLLNWLHLMWVLIDCQVELVFHVKGGFAVNLTDTLGMPWHDKEYAAYLSWPRATPQGSMPCHTFSSV
jgi:hypothetical protein